MLQAVYIAKPSPQPSMKMLQGALSWATPKQAKGSSEVPFLLPSMAERGIHIAE